MHSALFVATPPKDQQTWQYFLGFVADKLKSRKGGLRLAENVWLVNMHESPGALGFLVSMAEDRTISYGILSFEKAPEWLPGDFHPTSI